MNSRTPFNAVNVTIGISLFLCLLSLAYSEDGNGRVEVDPVRKETRNGQSVQMALHQNASTSNLTSTMNDRDGGMAGSSESLEVDGVTERKDPSEVDQESSRPQRRGRKEKLTYRQWIRISKCRNKYRHRGRNFFRRCRKNKGLLKIKSRHQTSRDPPTPEKEDVEPRSVSPSRKHDRRPKVQISQVNFTNQPQTNGDDQSLQQQRENQGLQQQRESQQQRPLKHGDIRRKTVSNEKDDRSASMPAEKRNHTSNGSTPSSQTKTDSPPSNSTRHLRPRPFSQEFRGRRPMARDDRNGTDDSTTRKYENGSTEPPTQLRQQRPLTDADREIIINSNTSSQMSGPELKEKQKSSSSYVDESSHRDHSMNPKKSCPTCQLSEEEMVELKTAQFKELLLQKLRMTEEDLKYEPMAGARQNFPKLPPVLRDKVMRDNAREESVEDFYAQDKELFISGYDMRRNCIKSRKVTGCYLFELNGKVDANVESAQLWFYKTPDANDMEGQTIRVFQLEKTRNGVLLRRNLILRQDLQVREGWVSMNVTRHVVSWGEKRMKTVMMAISCDNCRTRHYRSLYGSKAGYRPLLAVEFETTINSRKRRTTDTCTQCCRRELRINFEHIQMPRILAPFSLSIGYCHGDCNGVTNYHYNHTTLAQAARMRDQTMDSRTRDQIVPCCVPVAMRDTSLLLTDHVTGLLEQKVVPNVIVARCGCSV